MSATIAPQRGPGGEGVTVVTALGPREVESGHSEVAVSVAVYQGKTKGQQLKGKMAS